MGQNWLNTDGPLPTTLWSPCGFAERVGRAGHVAERAGTVVGRVEEDEWEVAVDDPRATEKPGGWEWSPYVYRSRDEMRVLTMSESHEMMAEADHEIAGQKARRWRQEGDEFDQAVERAKTPAPVVTRYWRQSTPGWTLTTTPTRSMTALITPT